MTVSNFINIPNSKLNKIINDFEDKGYTKLDKIITEKFENYWFKEQKI